MRKFCCDFSIFLDLFNRSTGNAARGVVEVFFLLITEQYGKSIPFSRGFHIGKEALETIQHAVESVRQATRRPEVPSGFR